MHFPQRLILFFSVLFILIIGVFFFYKPSTNYSKKRYKIECSYIGYACGICDAQYRINKIISSPLESELKLINSDIKIEYVDSTLHNKIEDATSMCAICYNFYFSGFMGFDSYSKHYIMKVDSCEYSLKNLNCCDVKKE